MLQERAIRRVNGKSVPAHVGNTTAVMISPPEPSGPALLTPFSAIGWQGLRESRGAGELMSEGLVGLCLWSRGKTVA